ncbi:MAG: ROK family protein [Chloroflexi bacterium]|nr:MAG: ROK family protein [Chloroflexota bacterium]
MTAALKVWRPVPPLLRVRARLYCTGTKLLLTAEQVIQAAQAGDAVATRIVEAAGVYVGIGLAAVATAFDPQIIVLGGGVVRQEGILLRRAYETFRERALAPLGSLVPIVPAALGDESGLWGAVALIEDRIR